MHCSGLNDPHPWTPERHLAQRLFDKMRQDFPEADMDYLFSNSLRHCQDAWTYRMTDQQKLKYIQWSQEDKLRSEKDGVSKTGMFQAVLCNICPKNILIHFLRYRYKVVIL